jgi:hypothetical protein
MMLEIRQLSKAKAAELLKREFWISVVGHPDIAAIMSKDLGIEIPVNRETVTLGKNDYMLVGQYVGPRLPAGATELPPDARILYIVVVPVFET